MRSHKNTCKMLAVLVGITVWACDGNTEPDQIAIFDAATARADLDVVDDVLQSEAWQSFRTLGSQFTVGSASAGLASSIDARSTSELSAMTLRRRVARHAAIVLSSVTTSSVPRIGLELRGTTFVFDFELGRYAPDPERTGAPENGVRFVLYAVNPVTGEPVDAEIGHADLTDEGDELPTGIALRFEVVSGGITFVEYAVSADGDGTSGNLTVTGFIGDGEARLDFAMTAESINDDGVQSMDLTFRLEMPDRAFSADGAVSNVNTETGASGEVELTVRTDTDTIEFSAVGDHETINATFRVNGKVFATVTGHPTTPEIRGEGGRVLTEAEMAVFGRLAQLQNDVFRMFHDLMRPVEAILSLRIIH